MFEGLIEFIESSVFTLVNQIVEREAGGAEQTQRIVTVLLQFGEKNPGMTRVMVGDALVFEHERLTARMNLFFDRVESQLRQTPAPGGRSRRLGHADGGRAGAGLGADGAQRRPAAALRPLGLQAAAHRAPGPGAAPAQRLTAAVLEIEVAGVRLALLAQRAACWSTSGLLVADAHIGKAVSFRRLGVPVPRGTTTQTLQRLSEAIAHRRAPRGLPRRPAAFGPRPCPGHAAGAGAVARRHAAVELLLVRGNHDDHAGDPPAAWACGVTSRCAGRPGAVPSPAAAAGAYVLAGHLHPCVVLAAARTSACACRVSISASGRRAAGLRRLHRHACGAPQPGERVFVVGDDAVDAAPYTGGMNPMPLESLIARAEALLARLEAVLPQAADGARLVGVDRLPLPQARRQRAHRAGAACGADPPGRTGRGRAAEAAAAAQHRAVRRRPRRQQRAADRARAAPARAR